jgi:hypothetical protein
MFRSSPSVFSIRIVIPKQAHLSFHKCPVDYGKPYDYPLRILLLRDEIPNGRKIRSVSAKIKLKEH